MSDPPRSSSAQRGSALKKVLREPLVHFLLAGAAIFAVLGWRGEPGDPASRTIHLTREDQARLSVNFAQVMGRPPTQAELDAVIARWVREEVLYREALRLGLDDGDAVVRKRLAQKMDLIAASAADTEQPSDEALQKWLESHPERFAQEMKLTFDQLYFTSRGRAVVAQTLLGGGADWTRVGDPVSLPARFDQAERSAVEAEMGGEFARALERLQPGPEWQGPVESALGWHLVRLSRREPGTLPPLAAIRQRVEDDWRAETGRLRQDAAYRTLRRAYTVTIDR
ncbi:MAG: peptidyl-prolyl cis-trans isomerase [Cypionkella sp.]